MGMAAAMLMVRDSILADERSSGAENDWRGKTENRGRRKKKKGEEGGVFRERSGPEHPAEEETFRLGHYGFHVCVYSSRPSCNISFSWIFNFFGTF